MTKLQKQRHDARVAARLKELPPLTKTSRSNQCTPSLDPQELPMLAKLLQRAIDHEQLSVGVETRKNSVGTSCLDAVCDNGDSVEVQLTPRGLQFLWEKANQTEANKQSVKKLNAKNFFIELVYSLAPGKGMTSKQQMQYKRVLAFLEA